MRGQLSGEVCCYTLCALKQTGKTYIHKNHLNWRGNICFSMQCISSEQTGPRGVIHTYSSLIYQSLFDDFEKKDKSKVKTETL